MRIRLILTATLPLPLLGPPALGLGAPGDEGDVFALLAEHCHACHGGEQRKGGLSLDSRAGWLRGGIDGAVVIPGDAAASRVIARVTSTDDFERMPPKGRPLTPDEVATLRAWIDAGLPFEAEAAHGAAPTPLALGDTPARHTAPNLVDAYVADHAEDHGVALPEAADAASFARRAHLDLVGLPPTPEEVAAYVAAFAADPAARSALVERLLADDRAYAEHWISFWNDLLRNDFQGTGYIDGGRAPITEWLFDALAKNMPYDRFVRELIAPPTPASEGFVKGIVWRGDNALVQQPPMQAAVNISQVFLGVNLKCAACHDSFVNDWSLARTFAFANCFSEAPLSLVRCETDLGVAAEYGFLWPELGAVAGELPRPERMAAVAGLVTAPANGYFARTIVNRLWAKLMGRGLVEPLDEMERAAWQPALLDALAREFVAGGYDLRALLRTIATSEAYARASAPAAPDSAEPFVFRGPLPKRLSAEQFYDALATVTGVWRGSPAFTVPDDGGVVRAWRVTLDPLSKALGRTAREQVTTSRESIGTTMQALELANGATLHEVLRAGAAALRAAFDAAGPAEPAACADALFARALLRGPTADERALAVEMLGNPVTEAGLEDLLWALVMLPEFQLIR